ncbi:MAG TPA: ATP-binding protein [Solirubrobacteraceae bacterium]|nr:ATP-binding protein [Solirubrobacteraceae bacterium]
MSAPSPSRDGAPRGAAAGRRRLGRPRGALARIPIRFRLTLVFATAMLIVLGVAGILVYDRVRSQLDSKIDLDVSAQATQLLALIERSPTGLAQAVSTPLVRGHETFVQVLDSHGRVLAATPGLKKVALLDHDRLRVALTRTVRFTRGKKAPLPEGSRLVSTPIRLPGAQNAVLIVGTSLDQRSSSLSSLALILGIVGPLALVVASFAGYRLTAATLRPVELMRRQAAAVTSLTPGVRLPLPAAHDEIYELGRTLNEMLGRLEESFAHEQTFIANASHELRTPLANLKAELDLAVRRPRPADELVAALHSVQVEVDRLSALADDLLTLARAEDGSVPIEPVECDVAEVLGAVRARIDASGSRVTISVPDGLRMFADPRRIEQAVGNLLDNALRYSDSDVSLVAKPSPSGGVEIHVEDAGPGFPASFLPEAFERFTRADPGRAGRGAGLGLSIVKTLARGHGGDAYAVNRESGGADVWIFVPDPRERSEASSSTRR